eukprot:g1343.t1
MIRKTLAKMLPLIVIWIGYSFTKTNASYSISSAGSMPIMTESTLPSDLYDMHHEHGCGSLTNMADCQANAKCTWIQMSDVGRKRPKDGNSELSGQITLLDGTVVDCMDQAMHKYGMTSGTSKQAYFNNDSAHAFFDWSVPFYEPYGEKEWWIGYNYSYYDKPDYTKVFGIPNGMQQSLLSTAFRYNESSTTSTFRYDGKYDLMMQAHSKVAFSEVHTCSADTQAYNGWRNTYTSIERTEGVDVCVPTECKQWLLPNCSPSPTFSDTLYSKTSDEWKSAGFPQNATEGLFCYQYWPWLFWTDRIDSQWTYRDGTAATFDENRHPWWIGSLGNSSQDAYDYDAELLIDRCDAKITEAECYASVQSSDTCGVSFFNRRFADSGCSSGGRYQCSCMSNSPTAFGAKNTPWISWYNYTNDALDSPNNEDYANSYILDASNDTDMVLTGFGTYKDLNGRYTLSDTLCYNRPVYTRTIESTGETFSLQFFASRANGKLQRQNYTMFHMSIGSNFDDANFLTSNGEYVVTEDDISSYNNTPTYTNRQIHKPVDGEVDLGKVSGNIFNGHIGGVEKHRHTYSDMFNGAIYGGPYDLVESQMYTWRLTKGACVSNADSIATDTWALGQCDRFDGGGFNCDVSVRHAYYPSEHNGKWFTYHENSFNASSSCVTTDDPSYKSYLTWLRTYLEPNFLAIKPSPTYDVDEVLYPHHTAPKLVLSAQNGSTYSAQAPVSEVWGLSNVTYDDEIGGVALSYWGVDKEYYFSHYVSMNGFYRVDMNTFNATPPSEVPDDLVEKCALGYDACNSSTLDYWKWYEKDVIMQTLEESKIYSLNRLDVLPGKCYNWPGDNVGNFFYFELNETDSNAPFFHGSGPDYANGINREFVNNCAKLNLTSRPRTPYTKGGIWARDCDTTYEAFSDTSFLCSSPVNKFWEARELCDDWTSETCDGVNSSDDCTPSGLWNKYVYGDATGWYNWRSLTSRYVGVTYENNGYCDLLGHPQTDLNTPCHKPADNRSPNVCNISPLHPYTHNTDALYSSSLFNGEQYGEWYAPVMFYGSPLIDNVFQHFGLKNASKAYLRPDRSQFGDWELEYAGCTDPYVTGINSTDYSSWLTDVAYSIYFNNTLCNPDPEVCAFTHDETEGDFYGFYGWGGEDSFTTNYQEPDWLRKSAVFCFNEDDDAAAGSENDVDANAACGWDTSADSNYRMVVKKYSDLSDCAASNEALDNPCKYVDAETGSEAFCGKGSWYDGSSCNRYYCDVEMTNVSGGLDTCFNASSLDDSDDFYFLASGSSVTCSSLVCDPNFTLQPYWDSSSSTDLSCSKGVFQGPTCNCSSSNVANSDMSSANAVNGSYGDVVTVTCDVGYEGGGDVTCQADGTFTVVTCTEKSNVCTSTSVDNSDKDADDAVNGSIGDVVFVTCDEGYAGGGNTTCHSNGIFDEVLCILTDSCKNETYETKIAVDRFDFLRSDSSSNYYYLDAAFQTQSAENTISKSASFLNSYGKATNLKLTLDDTDHSGFGAVSTGSFEGNDYGDPGSISFVIRTDRVFEDAPDVYYALQIRDTSGRRFVDCSSSWTLTYHYEDSEANVQNGTIACSAALAAIKTGSFAVTTFSSDGDMTARVHFELTDGSSQTITSNEETLDVQQKATYDSRDVNGTAGNFWVSAVMDKHFVWPNQEVTIAFYGYSDVNTEYLQFNIEWDSAVLSLDSTMSACHTSACILSGSHFDEIVLATNYNDNPLPSNKRAITCKDPPSVSSFSNEKVCYVKFTVGSNVAAGGYTNLFSIDSSTVEFTAESSNAWTVLASACTVDDYLGTSSSGRYLINSVQEKGMFSYIDSLTEDMINTRHLDSSTAVTRSLRHEVYENDATSSTITSGLTVTTSLSNVADVTTTDVSLSSSNYLSDSSLNITTTYGSFESYTIVNVWVPTSVGIGTDTSDTTLKRIYDCNSSYDDVYSWLYLSANATFSNGNPEDADMELGITDRVTFTSDNTTVVEIIDGNIARGVGPGSATISIVTNGATLPFGSAPELVLTVEDTDISVTMRAYAITTGFVITPTSNTLFSDFSSSNLQTGTITGYAEQTDLNAQGKTAEIVAYASFDDGETWRSLLEDDTKSQFELTMSSMDTTAVTVSARTLTVVNGAVKQCGYIVRASMVPTCSADGLIQSKQALVYLQMAEPYKATVSPSSSQSIGHTSDASAISTLYGSELTYDTLIELWIDTDGVWASSGNTEDGDDVVVLTFDPVGVLSYTVESSSVKVVVQNASYSGDVEVTFDWTSYCAICPNVTKTITVVKATAFEVKGQLYGLSNAYSTDTLTLKTLHYVTGTFRRGQLQSYLTTTEGGPTQISWKTITQEFSVSSPCPDPTGTAGNTILLTCNSAGNLTLNATIGDFSDAFSVFVTDTSTLVNSIAISISNGKLTGQIEDEESLTSFGTIGVDFDDGVTWNNVHSSPYSSYLSVDAYLNFALYDDYASATMDTVGTITLKGNSIELFNFDVSAKNSSVSKNSGDVLGVNLEIDSSSTADIDIQETGESILQFNNPFTVGDKITLEVSLRNSFDYLTISGFNVIFGTEGVVDFPFCATKSAATMCNSCCDNSMVVMDYNEDYAVKCGGDPSQRKIITFGNSGDEGIVDVSCAQPVTATEYTIFTIDVDVIGAGNTTVYATVEYVSDGASTNEQRNEGVTSVAGLGTIVVEGASRRLQSTEDNRRSSIHGVSTVVERNALHEEEMKKRRGRALLVTTSVGNDYGDVNNNSVYDVNDANMLLQLGQNSITSAEIANTNYTDLDYDGKNAILDSLYSSSIVGGVLAFVPEYRSLFQLVSNENDVGELLLSATLLENAAGANAKYASGDEWNVYFQIQLSEFSTFSNASGSCDEAKVRASFADANQWVNGNFSTVFATTDTSSNSITTYVVFGTENSGVFKAQWQYNASEAYCDFDVSYTIAHYRNTCPNSGDCGMTFGTSTFGIFDTGLPYDVFKMTENEIVHHWNVTCSDTQVAHSDHNETDSIVGSYGDVVTVACNDGYEGGGDVTCESGGSFTTVTCSLINCTSTSVQNSDKSSANAVNGSYGDVVTVTCDVGYEGDGSVLCESTGDWNDTLTCSNVSCADTEVANSDHSTTGSVSGFGLYGAVVAVTCDVGYEGGGSVLCGSTGDWNDTLACSLTETTTAASSSSSSMIVGLSIGIGGFVFVTALVVVCFLRHRVKHNRRGTKQSSHSSMFQSITNPRILAEKAFDHNAVHTDIRETRPMQDRRVESETGIVLDDQIDGRYGRRNGQYTHTAYPLAVASPDLFATSTTPGSHRSVSPEMRDDETDPALDENGVFQL